MPLITYVTDVEGNWEYFLSFVRLSEGIRLVQILSDGSADLELEAGWGFVFGGDVCDKGDEVGGTIRVTMSLVRLKRKYPDPDRVTLILGNRDLNKMRFTSELADSQIARLADVPGPYWVPENKRVAPLQYIRDKVAAEKQITAGEVTEEQLTKANTVENRLRWMLDMTMGSGGEFERRSNELQFLRKRKVSEMEVVESFAMSVEDGGFMREFISLGKLAVIIDRTLFVHGGICLEKGFANGDTDCLGFVPGRDGRVDDVHEWVEALNAWKDAMVAEWEQQPQWNNPLTTLTSSDRGGHALMDYVVPGSLPSVIQSCHLDQRSMPMPMPLHLAAQLNGAGVARMVVGHIPHGTCPTVIKSGGPGETPPFMEIIMADTSYSDMSQPDNRGSAVSDVVLRPDGTAHVHGRIDLGEIDYELRAGVGPSSELVGQMEPIRENAPRRFVKAVLPGAEGKSKYVMCEVHGFRYTYDEADEEAVQALLAFEELNDESQSLRSVTRLHSQGDNHTTSGSLRCNIQELDALVEHTFKEIDEEQTGYITISQFQAALVDNREFVNVLGHVHAVHVTGDLLVSMADREGMSKFKLDQLKELLHAATKEARRKKLRESAEAVMVIQRKASQPNQVVKAWKTATDLHELQKAQGRYTAPPQAQTTTASANPFAKLGSRIKRAWKSMSTGRQSEVPERRVASDPKHKRRASEERV